MRLFQFTKFYLGCWIYSNVCNIPKSEWRSSNLPRCFQLYQIWMKKFQSPQFGLRLLEFTQMFIIDPNMTEIFVIYPDVSICTQIWMNLCCSHIAASPGANKAIVEPMTLRVTAKTEFSPLDQVNSNIAAMNSTLYVANHCATCLPLSQAQDDLQWGIPATDMLSVISCRQCFVALIHLKRESNRRPSA